MEQNQKDDQPAKNTESSSEQSIQKNSLPTIPQDYMNRKAAEIRLGFSRLETHTFKRFLMVPLVLSNILFIVFACASLTGIIGMMSTSNDALGFMVNFMLAAGGFSVSFLLAIWLKEWSKREMIRSRLWDWVHYKFDTWEDFQEWVEATSASELEYLASLDDGSWEPKEEGGGELIPVEERD